ncbi:ABC transporter ATP-binding protein [Brevibacillus fortis]|uniref:Peptide ABC transporter ATP-binding protein n=1 Tax=Brevibacillus fortis TaxID=2126352 RepID=A0A2P7V5V4_9BACL|nr:ABC transporter ATP-binding protein [Brevibacillus fortis]MED1780430.1 ABC transporter ATP-binding protein [Brevibacillus fortis]PSJ94591.1 peptide ABC transporter ATP-binding protein [Brevibacillus fortis]
MIHVPLLEVKNLRTTFSTELGQVTAVDGVSFQVDSGETVGLVGESGCGKSVTSLSILRLFRKHSGTRLTGEIFFEQKELLQSSMEELQEIRGNRISMIFQDPMSSLNPVYTVGNQIAESLMLHQKLSKKAAQEKTIEMLTLVGIPSPDKRVNDYPHQLSGGMRQRVMIAMGLCCQPKLLIADEPTTALDVTIQAQILDLMLDLQKQLQMGILLITHDLGVVAEVCDRVLVMYLGQIVEEASVETLFENPKHPYTIGLMKSIPTIDGKRGKKLHVIEGIVPSLHQIPKGCRFAPRCPLADEKCRQHPPDLFEIARLHQVRCWHHERIGVGGVAFGG